MTHLTQIFRLGLLLCLVGFLGHRPLFSQTGGDEDLNCEERIKLAEELDAYPNRVISLLKEKCFLPDQDLDLAERRLRVLAEAYLLQVPPNVDSAEMMWQALLLLDPEYKLDTLSSSEELLRLSRRFVTRPRITFEVFLGGHAPLVMPGARYGVENLNNAEGAYETIRIPRLSGQVGVGFWYGLNSDVKKWPRIRRWEVGAQVQLRTTTFAAEQWLSTSFPYDSSFALVQLKERQTALDFTLGVRHQFDRRKFAYERVRPIFSPFLQLDVQPMWLIGSRLTSIERRSVILDPEVQGQFFETAGRITGLATSQILNIRSTFGMGIGVGAGGTVKIRRSYLAFLLRYHMGLNNAVRIQNRWANQELVYKYGYVDDNWAMHRLELSLNYWFTVYSPSKKKSRNIP